MQVAHPHSGSSSTWFLVELEFGNVGFWGEGKNRVPGEKPLGARERTNNKLNPHMASTPGLEPGPHWWEASALTNAPPLLPSTQKIFTFSRFHFIIYPRGSLSHRRHKSYNQLFAAACNNFRGNLLFRSATSVRILPEIVTLYSIISRSRIVVDVVI